MASARTLLETIGKAPDRVTFRAMANARSDYLAIERKLETALEGKAAGFAKKMSGLYDDAMIDAAQKSNIQGLVNRIRDANTFTASEHGKFEQDLIKKIVDTKKPEAIAALVRGRGVGNEEARDLFKILPKSLHQPVRKQIISDAMQQSIDSTSKAFNERKFAKLIGNIGDERGKIIFGNNWKNIKELSEIMEKINGPVGMQGGSGASLQNFSILKNAMLLVIPGGKLREAITEERLSLWLLNM